MTLRSFLLVLTLCLGTCFGTLYSSAQTTTTNYDQLTKEVLQLVNEHRTGMGLTPLKMDNMITKVAATHSNNMATGKVPFSHNGFDDRVATITKQIKTANDFAENVAAGPHTAKAAVDMWLRSPEHKKNIEGHYDLTGIAIARSKDGTIYYTELFVNKGK